MIRTTKVGNNNGRGIIFPGSPLVDRYCVGTGLEIGASAHNPFNLPGARNVAFTEDTHIWDKEEIKMCGAYAEVDIVAEGDNLPVDDDSQDYIISSHVLEHLPNPIGAMLEWQRVVKPGGTICIIVPKRDELPRDASRPISTREEFYLAHKERWTIDTVPPDVEQASGGRRGHYWVFDKHSLLYVVMDARANHELCWDIVCDQTDDKVGNGWLLIAKTWKNCGTKSKRIANGE